MLQQTQVSRAAPRYERFLDRFPTVEALAAAARLEVLAEWSGLGYNRRAVNLHETAAIVASDGWPRKAADLAELPGVGPYTAAAVACFAFGEPVAAVDTNLRRVLSRWHGTALRGRELREVAGAWLDAERPAEWNQAIMDLGATVCGPRNPRCEACPVQRQCADPSIYLPPRSQGRFQGSNRQARGAVIKALTTGDHLSLPQLTEVAGLPSERLEKALTSLLAEGLVERAPGSAYRLP